jgi:hypothetical protein
MRTAIYVFFFFFFLQFISKYRHLFKLHINQGLYWPDKVIPMLN